MGVGLGGGWPEAGRHCSEKPERGNGNQAPPTYAGLAKGILLKAGFTVTAVGAREVVAHLALLTAVHACLTLIHICQGKVSRAI